MERYREVLEVAKFCSGKDILRGGCSVTKVWAEACGSEELWRDIVEEWEEWERYRKEGELSKELYRRMRERRKLVWVRRKEVRIFDCRTQQWEPTHLLPSYIRWTYTPAVLPLPDTSLLFCGGNSNPSTHTHRFLSSLTRLSNMAIPRKTHSLAAVFHHVYAFGGNNGNKLLKSAEKLDPDSNDGWRTVTDMTVARAGFNACVDKRCVYLCGGYTSQCELFDTISEQYRALSFSLPQSNSQTGMILSECGAILYTKNWLLCVGADGKVLDTREIHQEKMDLAEGPSPVRAGEWIYTIDRSGVVRLSIETLQWHNVELLP